MKFFLFILLWIFTSGAPLQANPLSAHKATCTSLGFNAGTEEHGDCVMKLLSQNEKQQSNRFENHALLEEFLSLNDGYWVSSSSVTESNKRCRSVIKNNSLENMGFMMGFYRYGYQEMMMHFRPARYHPEFDKGSKSTMHYDIPARVEYEVINSSKTLKFKVIEYLHNGSGLTYFREFFPEERVLKTYKLGECIDCSWPSKTLPGPLYWCTGSMDR